MASRASVAHHKVTGAEAERKAPPLEPRVTVFPQSDSSSGDNASSSPLSAHQKQLLAGFGVLSSGTLQRRIESVGREIRHQDVPASPDSRVYKQVATSPFLPTFIQPHRNTPSYSKKSTMHLGGFDPSKYGAPPKKQRTFVPDVPIKTTSSQAASLKASSMPTEDQISGSVSQSTVSEASYPAASSQSQATEVSNGIKHVETTVLTPKSTNRISIPGFDPSRYGKSNLRTSQNVTQDEANMNTCSGADQMTIQPPKPPVDIPSTSFPQKQGSASLHSLTQITERPQEYIGELNSSVLSTSHGGTIPTQSQVRASQMAPSDRSAPVSVMSKEERLKQVQQASMREIGIRNRTKGHARESTSLRDLHLAREPVSSEFRSPSSTPLTPRPEESSASLASATTTSPTVKLHDSFSAPRTISSTLPPALPGMSKEERLRQVQQARLREIGIRNRGDGRAPETTSLMDLNLARTPAISEFQNPATAPNSVELSLNAGFSSSEDMVAETPRNKSNNGGSQDNVTASTAPNVKQTKARNPRWCTNEELKPEMNFETNSNTWGSDIPTNASVASNDSVRPMQLHGRMFNGPPAGKSDEVEALMGWDGKIQPPPIDWNDRPRFSNNSPAFRNGFNNWFATAAPDNRKAVDRTSMFKEIPYHFILNIEWHADGISMVRKEFTLNADNISKYGYEIDPADVVKYAEPITAEDFEDWGKLDMREPDNVAFKQETAEQLVKNWRIHQENSRKNITLAVMPEHKAAKENKAPKSEVNPNKPSVNIYLRPAIKADVGQLTDLYNWYVENSMRTSETRAVELSDMRERFDYCKSDSLPFIVAVLKSKMDVARDHHTGFKGEHIVGFACSTGFTAADYVEHIAAELEIYVHHEFVRMGIGRCLLDRLLCATDRGHMERGGYPFHCDPAERHWYEVGGARNLHKLMFVTRHISRPRKEEEDAITWLKKWLVKDWDFELEATLKKTGAKNGRFLDTTYFSKYSKWLPEDGRVPDPAPKDHKHAMLG